jgi:hypothetical protein
MKKIIILVVIALVFIGGTAAAIYTISRSTTVPTTSTASTSSSGYNNPSGKIVKACDILTRAAAEEVLGKNIDTANTPIANPSPESIDTSFCGYMSKYDPSATTATGLPKTNGVTVLLRAAKNKAGADSAKLEFNNRPPGVEPVKGIGDDAFFDPGQKQLHILKGANWYVISYFKDSVMNGSLENDKVLASKLKFQ